MSQLFLFVGATDEWHLSERGRTQDAALTQVVAGGTPSFQVLLRLELTEPLGDHLGGGDFAVSNRTSHAGVDIFFVERANGLIDVVNHGQEFDDQDAQRRIGGQAEKCELLIDLSV